MDVIPAVEEKKVPWRFEGWLLLLAFGILVSPFKLSFNFWNVYRPIWNDGTLHDIMVTASLGFKLVIISEIVANVVFLGLSTFLIYLFFKKKAAFRTWYFIVAASSMAFLIANSLVIILVFPNIPVVGADILKSLLSSSIALFIWAPYLFKSERSRNTFVL